MTNRLIENKKEIDNYAYGNLTHLLCFFALLALMLVFILVVLNTNSILVTGILAGTISYFSSDVALLVLRNFATK